MISSEDSARGRLIVDAAPTLRTIETVHAKLRDLLVQHSVVEIDCSAVTEADVSFIQLLIAAKRSAEISGKTVTLAAPATGALRHALVRGGFVDPIADGSATGDAFWLKGSSPQ